MRKVYFIVPVLVGAIFFSCGSSETKTTPEKKGIDTLQYEDVVTAATDTLSLIDSLVAASANFSLPPEDTAALTLKARLAADTSSTKISDSVKSEIRQAREYMRQKQNQ